MKIINDLISHIIYQAINIIGVIIGGYAILKLDNVIEGVIVGGICFVVSWIAFFYRQKFH